MVSSKPKWKGFYVAISFFWKEKKKKDLQHLLGSQVAAA